MKKTVPYINNLKGNRVISMMTAYDYPTAKAVSEAEIDIVLVGDSLAQVVLGHDDTLSVTVDEMLHHVKAVTNANPSSLVVADMPYLSYHINISDSLKNAGRFIQEGKADAALKKKADKSGMPLGILRKVFNRGVAAWRTGHRPGTTPTQWGLARVNSFVTKSSGTWGKADKDLAAKVRG